MSRTVHVDNPLKIKELESLMKERPVVIMYYMPGCYHCDAMKPEWERFEKSLKSKNHHVGTARVNSNHMTGVKGSERVSGFPTVLLIEDEKVKSEYSGDRTAEDLERFTNSNTSQISTSSKTQIPTEYNMSRDSETPETVVNESVDTEHIFGSLFSKPMSNRETNSRKRTSKKSKKSRTKTRTNSKSKSKRKSTTKKGKKSRTKSKRVSKSITRTKSKSKTNSKRKTRRNTQSRIKSSIQISPTPTSTERGLEELFDM